MSDLDEKTKIALWVKAKSEHVCCTECEEWADKNLSLTCPKCDLKILDNFVKLIEKSIT